MNREILSPHQKALQVNLDASKYGTFVEIGAGQEVARWFFLVGGAAGTIAKTMSAYDMVISDAIYGPCERYVSRQRLQAMLEREYDLLRERLDAKRGDKTRFFVFADTVAARSYTRHDDAHGWLGVRFQTDPRVEPSQIIIHLRLLDTENVQEQETLGLMGVNLIYGALYLHDDPATLIGSLMDNLTAERVEVDLIKFSGPAFATLDNRLMSLQLVEQGLTKAAMFTADGEVVQPAEVLYKKPILVERGSFRPVTKVTLDMLECAQALFVQEPGVQGQAIVVLMEMTLKNLTDGGTINHKDFLDRADLLGALGKTVLISNYGEFHRLAGYLFRYTKKMIGLVMGVPTLKEIFEEKYYADLEGGILESFGRLFKNDLKLYVYPLREPATGAVITAGNLRVAPNLRHLYAYLIENRFIESLRDVNEQNLPIFSRDVLAKLRTHDSTWEAMVPSQVAKIIQDRKLFGYQG
ncbi:MAG: TonB-dependent receptor [Verrucomicrobia bacterium]|nr:TonB-dependent receptor [Verrucomicrobiota bacterium]